MLMGFDQWAKSGRGRRARRRKKAVERERQGGVKDGNRRVCGSSEGGKKREILGKGKGARERVRGRARGYREEAASIMLEG